MNERWTGWDNFKLYQALSAGYDRWGVIRPLARVREAEKMGNHQKKELLEELRKAAHCDCISDLRGPERSVEHLVKRAEELLKTGDYALKEWTDAVQYITGCSWSFHDKEEAAGYLKSFFS